MNQLLKNPPVICVDIGGSFIKFGVSHRQGEVTTLDKAPMPADSWEMFAAALENLIQTYRDRYPADAALAISAAGIVSPESGEVFASNIPAFKGKKLVDELGTRLGREVCIANDADCFALAEAVAGKGKGHRVVFGVILGTGVGGGLAVNGRILSGAGGLTGEWGHGPITRTEIILDGKPRYLPRLACGCGQQGCLDTYGGARGLERLHHALHNQTADSFSIINRWQQGEPLACRTIDAWTQVVGEPLAYSINLTGASLVAVGGGLAGVPALIEALDNAVRPLILRKSERPVVVAGCFSQNGGMVGASVLGRAQVRCKQEPYEHA
ncbi:ROK family protein [Brenneria izadpanahii]|uniref:N-acetyl-D-glucosamine kinase n=1 Tax=Brenneria izadpanahii TaxID=2722756 RepID=A0ABX7UW60_9GAMM|nr:ROK family protein [Brenneria izadpanahii]QTF07849.1 ROK family protein [Brenneria izadpanahii]